jgi:hypothetical protein
MAHTSGSADECRSAESCVTGFKPHCAECEDRVCLLKEYCDMPALADVSCSMANPLDGGA